MTEAKPHLVDRITRCKECGGLMHVQHLEGKEPPSVMWVCENDPRHLQATYSRKDEA